MREMIKIFYWPDGTWCLAEDIDDVDYMSDDYTWVNLPAEHSLDEIEDIITKLVSRMRK